MEANGIDSFGVKPYRIINVGINTPNSINKMRRKKRKKEDMKK